MPSCAQDPGIGAGNETPDNRGISVVDPLDSHPNVQLLEQKLLQSDRLALAGRAILETVHDFNNIFYTISCISDVLLLEQPQGGKYRNDLDEIKKAAHRGAALTRQLVSFSRPSAITLETVELGELIRTFSPVIGRILGERVQLQLDVGVGTWRVLSDRHLLEHLLLELTLDVRLHVPNARSFYIALSDAEAGQCAPAADRDANPGPCVELLVGCDDIDVSLARPASPQLVTLMNALKQTAGADRVVRQPNSQIMLHLRRDLDVATAGTAQADPASECPREATVLIVEDEDAARSATSRILKNEGYNVVEASSVQQALDVSSRCVQSIDLLFTDVILPDGDGVTLCNKLRKLHPRLRVLFVSGYGCDVLARHQMPEHGYHFMEKPCRIAKVIETVRQALC